MFGGHVVRVLVGRAGARWSLGLAILLASTTGHTQSTRFDGAWSVTLVCPAHSGKDDAKGYTRHFKGEVVNGELSATRETEGEPGWHYLRGPIGESGEAMLRFGE